MCCRPFVLAVQVANVDGFFLNLAFEDSIGDRLSGKEFGENWKFKIAARGSSTMKK